MPPKRRRPSAPRGGRRAPCSLSANDHVSVAAVSGEAVEAEAASVEAETASGEALVWKTAKRDSQTKDTHKIDTRKEYSDGTFVYGEESKVPRPLRDVLVLTLGAAHAPARWLQAAAESVPACVLRSAANCATGCTAGRLVFHACASTADEAVALAAQHTYALIVVHRGTVHRGSVRDAYAVALRVHAALVPCVSSTRRPITVFCADSMSTPNEDVFSDSPSIRQDAQPMRQDARLMRHDTQLTRQDAPIVPHDAVPVAHSDTDIAAHIGRLDSGAFAVESDALAAPAWAAVLAGSGMHGLAGGCAPGEHAWPATGDTRAAELAAIADRWDFCAPDLARSELLHVAYTLLLPHAAALDVPCEALRALVLALEAGYRAENPYHNFHHAVDVLQCVHLLFSRRPMPLSTASASLPTASVSLSPGNVSPERASLDSQSQGSQSNDLKSQGPQSDDSQSNDSQSDGNDRLPMGAIAWSLGDLIVAPEDRLAIMLAALGHDVGHPGLTNSFLVEHESPLALVYNDRAVLESLHAATLFALVRHPRCNIAAHWDRARWRDFRAVALAAVLGTDMAQHFDLVSQLSVLFERLSADASPGDTADNGEGRPGAFERVEAPQDMATRRMLAVAAIKFADICNVVRPFAVARRWGFHLVCEFFAQSDWEAALGCVSPPGAAMPPRSPIPARTADLRNLAAGQRHFISAVAAPLFELMARRFGCLRGASDALAANVAAWHDWDPACDNVLDAPDFASLLRGRSCC